MADRNKKNEKGNSQKKNTRALPPKNDGHSAKKHDPDAFIHKILPYIFVVCTILLAVCFIFNDGALGKFIYDVFFGMFGIISFTVPFLFAYFAMSWKKWAEDDKHILKCIFAGICIVFGGALWQIIMISLTGGNKSDYCDILKFFEMGTDKKGAGLIGGFVGFLIYKAFNSAAGIILSGAVVFVFGIFLFGLTPKDIWIHIKYSMKMRAERRRELEKKRAAEREFEYENEESDGIKVAPDAVDRFDPKKPFETAVPDPNFDINFSDGEFETEKTAEIEKPVNKAPENEEEEPESGAIPMPGTLGSTPVYTENGEIDLSAIFVDSEENDGADVTILAEKEVADSEEDALSVSKTDMSDGELIEKPKPVREKPVYKFPPVSLLAPPEKKKTEDVGAELRSNAQKLVETLRSFRVNVSISSVSRGPTITRYELIPEAGTRVRTIANLVDDISLALATSGIRIEAPIPGKAAVGIEVPNRTVSTVTLRELIENPAFSEAKSKLTVCLGKDVGGTPIMFDIAKMPHLLIAGATGMGKSVCINSLITSILYKASPDEVKLILIDPKKVEFNIYNGIPHLQIPVVSEPKKAAGALHWAVTEMERRYELIEEVGARKIETYNEIAAKRGMEILPYTVIIIDELADLMMTAPDAVEDSICRLAQKARAAGMHIIIGTQRPSVDVITGLIKANIPSRIAFTVASQVDSRTIIDIAGAEKLIGRGDMLYYPVGLSKPMRAQGAFISEDDVEKITNFVKESVGETEYDSDIMESIEREAQAIGQSQKKGGGEASLDDGAGDTKLRDALELATDVGKISTSLLQRKLSIGYGRAAKIIDIMEARGFVSAPDGQKPREVLLTKTQFREMVVNNDERLN